MFITDIITIAAIIAFTLRSIIFITGMYRERKNIINDTHSENPFVSIIVPARNEESHIADCIRSIYNNKYPDDKLEIIAVNDRSEDKTLTILEDLQTTISNLKIVNITSVAQKQNLQGKPGALQAGIDIAQGEIIMFTDADCIVGEHWIETISTQYADKNVGLVASFTNVLGNRLFDKIQAIEWTYLHTMASAGVGLGQPLGCYGNNLSVRLSTYESVGGYNNIRFSVTEDLALLQAVYNSGSKVRYITHKDADVDTYACKTFGEYLKQRHRWAVGGLDLGWRAAIFIVSSALLILGVISTIIFWNPLYLSAIVLSRIFWDYWLIGSSFNILQKKELKKWIPAGVLFFIILESIVPFLVLKKQIEWKGQIFNRTKD
jgi:cellulose synthase/poly-beta-1,6-N-acetylglucosamine synthase-like glycosyltransferase